MWVPDIRTLFLVQFLINAFLTLMLYVFWKNEKTYPGFRTWMLSLPVMACASFFFMRLEWLPFPFLITAANLLLLLALLMRFDSIWKFVWSRPLPRTAYIICLPGTLVFVLITAYFPGLEILRVPVLTVEILAFAVIGCIPLLSRDEPETYRIRRAIFSIIVLWSVIFIARLIVWFSVSRQFSLYDTNPVNILYLLFSIAADIATTGLFLLLNMARARAELRSSEEQYKNLIEKLPDYIVVHNAEQIHYANPPLLELMNISPEDIRRRSITSLLTPTSAEIVRQFAAKPHAGAVHDDPLEIDIVRNDGTIRHGIMRTIRISSRDFSGFLSVITDITELKMAENSLGRATTKLNLLTHITLNEIQNAVFYLSGYIELGKQVAKDERVQQVIDRQMEIVQSISKLLLFAKEYQGLGLKPPDWQNVMHAYLIGVSHINPVNISRTIAVDGLEVYADPLLENVFSTLAENVVIHSRTATELSLRYEERTDGLTLIFEDNGIGIPAEAKEKIFERKTKEKKGLGLFLVREILGITEITIRETGEPGKGARFEIAVPKGAYRFPGIQ